MEGVVRMKSDQGDVFIPVKRPPPFERLPFGLQPVQDCMGAWGNCREGGVAQELRHHRHTGRVPKSCKPKMTAGLRINAKSKGRNWGLRCEELKGTKVELEKDVDMDANQDEKWLRELEA
jgi:hypothetical protein